MMFYSSNYIKQNIKKTLSGGHQRGFIFEIYYFACLLRDFKSRDFFRAAVFFLITPRFAALSIALYACDISFSASLTSPAKESLLIFLRISRMVRRRLSLKTRLRLDARSVFFAPLVIGIL